MTGWKTQKDRMDAQNYEADDQKDRMEDAEGKDGCSE